MRLKTSLIKKFTEGLDSEYACIYDSIKTRIYDCHRNKVIVLTKERPKYEYYKFALSEGYEHIPKIYDLIEDPIHGIYIIKREELYPITDHKKLVRLDLIEQALINTLKLNDRIVEEAIKFQKTFDYQFNFDFSPHCFMETKNKKIVVSDLFCEED
jgi:hypothetical protein